MDLQKTLNEKKEYLRKLVEDSNNLQDLLNKTNQEILRTDGSIRQLNELLEAEKKEVKEN